MTDDSTRKTDTAAAFGASAAAYGRSRTHATGDDLTQLATWCAETTRERDESGVALDVATGAGHTAGALLEADVGRVIAADAAPEMVSTALDTHPGLQGVVSDAERLPVRDGSLDAVTCRIAAHHFPDPEGFVHEVARVLRSGGVFAFEDNVAPADDDLDRYLNRLERLRDPTHVRSHRPDTWTQWLTDAGFSVEKVVYHTKRITVTPWIDRIGSLSETHRAQVRQHLQEASEAASTHFAFEFDDGNVTSFASHKALILARRVD